MVQRLIAFIVVAALPLGLTAGEPDAADDVKALIEQLASPNAEPEIDGPDARYAPEYDRKAQRRVHDAMNALYKLGPPAFPYLIDNFDDGRYSFTGDSGPADYNFTVGHVCRELIGSQVEAFSNWWSFSEGEGDPRGRARRPSYCTFHLHDVASAKQWYKRHKDMSLVELQAEALQWVIAREEEEPDKFTKEEREYLADKLRELQAAKRPFRPYFLGSK